MLEKNYFQVEEQFCFQTKRVTMGCGFFSKCGQSFHTWLRTKVHLQWDAGSSLFQYSLLQMLHRWRVLCVWWFWEVATFFSNGLILYMIQYVAKLHHIISGFFEPLVYRNEKDKLMNRNTLLHYWSYHPRHLLQNLPYGQFLRLKLNSSLHSD